MSENTAFSSLVVSVAADTGAVLTGMPRYHRECGMVMFLIASVCVSLCLTFESFDLQKLRSGNTSSEYLPVCQIRISRSSVQGQGHRIKMVEQA